MNRNLKITPFPGAMYSRWDFDSQLRPGGHRVQAEAQRLAGQHRAQVGHGASDHSIWDRKCKICLY